jgi:ATP-dependent DNA ligase
VASGGSDRALKSMPPAEGFPIGMPALLQTFAETADALAATSKKLIKSALLGEYFQHLQDADLARAARYFAGHQFAMSDARTTNVGGSLLAKSLSEALGVSLENLSPRYVRLGDAGEVASEVVSEVRGPESPPTITLVETESLLARLSETRGTLNKQRLLVATFSRTTALEAKYLVKLLTGDLRIGLREGLVEDAIARAFDQPLAQVAQANMLLGDIGETAVRSRNRDLANISMRLFHPFKFMLATAAADLSDVARTMPSEFFVEDKFDGIRAQAHVNAERVAMYSRTLDEISQRFPELIPALNQLPTDAIIDGEIVPALEDEILPFAELQKRLGRKIVSEELLATTPVVFVAYDLLYAGGQVLLDESLEARRQQLEQLIPDGGRVRLSAAKRFSGVASLDDEFKAARERGNEGLMIKDPRSMYKPGKRGRDWLKLKRALATLDVAVTAVEVGHGKRRHLLSDYTFAVRRSEENGELLNIGKAYSGLTDAELAEMSEWFRDHTIREFAHGRVRIVEPKIVLEVAFDRVQESKRHKSGYALRFPRILRLRTDKSAAEIDTLETVRKLAAL